MRACMRVCGACVVRACMRVWCMHACVVRAGVCGACRRVWGVHACAVCAVCACVCSACMRVQCMHACAVCAGVCMRVLWVHAYIHAFGHAGMWCACVSLCPGHIYSR